MRARPATDVYFSMRRARCAAWHRRNLRSFPEAGWVEHDAEEIWATQLEVAKEAMANIQATAATYVR